MVDMGNIWDRTVAFIGDHARAVISIAVLAILLPSAIGNVVWGASLQCDPPISQTAAAIITVVLALPTLWGQLALTALVVAPAGENAGRVANGAFPRAVIAMVALFAVIAIGTVPLMLMIQASGGALAHGGCDADAVANAVRPAWYIPTYGVLFAIVVIYVSVRLTMLYPVVVAEKLALPAIGRAFRLSRGIVWKLIGVWLVFMIVYLIAGMAVSSAFGAVFRLFAPGAGPFAATSILLAVLSAGVKTAFTVIVATFAALVYSAVTGAVGERPAA